MQTQAATGPQDSIRSLLSDIESFCRSYDMAETTFGRQAVNDGKLCQRLRTGKGITINTVHKIHDFIRKKSALSHPLSLTPNISPVASSRDESNGTLHESVTSPKGISAKKASPQTRPFRFYDNRQKYLGFVNTCDEKWKVAERAAHELSHVQPVPPALRIFDAGVGDGSVLSYLLRATHQKFPTIPFL